jgi:hypothetical protein
MSEPLQPTNDAAQPAVRKSQTSTLKLPGLERAGTGALAKTPSKPLPAAEPAAQPEPAPPELDLDDPVQASRARMSFINAYLKAPSNDPAFQDKAMVYRVMSDERAHQQALVVELMAERKRLADDDPLAAELDSRLKTANSRQGNLFSLMKRLTGVKGTTGGTDFIVAPDDAL